MLRALQASRLLVVKTGVVLLAACSTPSHRVPQSYAQTFDSPSNVCSRNPKLCPPLVGEQAPAAPAARLAPSRPPPLSGPQSAAITIAAVGRVVQVVIDASLEMRIREALSQCADDARAEILLKYFNGKSPTQAECSEVVGTDGKGDPITRAMQMGIEQHALALKCAQEKLEELKPGGFSITPRYRVNPNTRKVQFLSQAQVKNLLDAGRSAELRGSIEPDIVIHLGNPLHVQAVFDFKFPCVNGGRTPWRKYPKNHPYAESTQRDVYTKVLSDKVFRVLPHWGVLP